MYSLFGIVALIVLFFMIRRLEDRVRRLERSIKTAAGQTTAHAAMPAAGVPLVSQKAPIEEETSGASHSDWLNKLINWCREDWLLKLGALLLLVGFGWLVTYAFLNNWIGPMGRIALGIIAGAAIMIVGRWRIATYVHQGGIFLALGSTVILLTIFAAREIYDFFTPATALVVMFLSTAFVALSSVQYKTRSLAYVSLVLAAVAPLLTDSPSPDYIALFSYLLVIVVGTVWVVYLTGWRTLTTAALVVVALYSIVHFGFGYGYYWRRADLGTLLLFAYGFAAVFFVTNMAGIIRSQSKRVVADLVTAGGNGLLLLAWILRAADDEWKSLIIASWMVVFAAGAFALFKITGRREPFYVHAAVGVAMLAAATSAELGGQTLVIAYAIESACISVITYLVMRDVRIAERASLLLAGPVILSFESFGSRMWKTAVFNKHFFVLLVLAAALFGLGLFLRYLYHRYDVQNENRLYPALLIIGSAYAFALLWLSLHSAIDKDDVAKTIALVVYTLVGLGTNIFGKLHNRRIFRLYGGVLLGIVVLRLLFVDMREMAVGGRVITFFLVGALLMSTAFIGRKRRAEAGTPPGTNQST